MDYSYLTAKFHKRGKVSQNNLSTAGARVKLAAIQRDHRSRRCAGKAVSLTPRYLSSEFPEALSLLEKVSMLVLWFAAALLD